MCVCVCVCIYIYIYIYIYIMHLENDEPARGHVEREGCMNKQGQRRVKDRILDDGSGHEAPDSKNAKGGARKRPAQMDEAAAQKLSEVCVLLTCSCACSLCIRASYSRLPPIFLHALNDCTCACACACACVCVPSYSGCTTGLAFTSMIPVRMYLYSVIRVKPHAAKET